MSGHDIESYAVQIAYKLLPTPSEYLRDLDVGVLTMPVSILIKRKGKKNMNINVSLYGYSGVHSLNHILHLLVCLIYIAHSSNLDLHY